MTTSDQLGQRCRWLLCFTMQGLTWPTVLYVAIRISKIRSFESCITRLRIFIPSLRSIGQLVIGQQRVLKMLFTWQILLTCKCDCKKMVTPNIVYYIVKIITTFQLHRFSKFLIIVIIMFAHFAKLF